MEPARILAIVGPTCTGKSNIATLLARRHGCAVLSADAMQVYRGLDIGTGKAFDSFASIRTFGTDLVDPDETYSASLYQQYGRGVLDAELAGVGRVIVCGGTGFYVRALLDDMRFAPGEQDDNPVREKYLAILRDKGPLAVWEALHAIDADSANAIHPNNVKRVIRALEMAQAGESYADRLNAFGSIESLYEAVYVAFSLPREELYARINARVDRMIEAGLVDEVQRLMDAGLLESSTARQAIGYRQIIEYLSGACTLDDAIDAIKQATRRYAKRQLSWFSRDSRVQWIDGTADEAAVCELVEQLVGWKR